MSVPPLFADREPAEPTLTVRLSRRSADQVRVAVTGEIDMDTAHRLDDPVSSALTMPEIRRVGVDLAGVTFMHSSETHVLVPPHTGARHTGSTLIVTHPQPTVLRVLQITGLTDALLVADSDS